LSSRERKISCLCRIEPRVLSYPVAECKITTDYPATGIIKENFRIFTECFYITPLLWCFFNRYGWCGYHVCCVACYSRGGNFLVGRFPIPEFSIFGLTALQMAHVQGRGYSDIFFLDVRESAGRHRLEKEHLRPLRGNFWRC